MTTALNIIERALLDLRVIEGGGSASAQEASDGLVYLNDLIQSWSNEGLLIYSKTTDSLTMTGAQSYTFGTGGVLNSERPVSVDSAYFTLTGYDYPVSIITREQYQSIADKTATSTLSDVIFVDYTYPYATVYVYPVPSSGTLKLVSSKKLTELSTTSTVLSMPQGYERALRLALEVELMPQYGKQDALIIASAEKAKRDLKRLNAANSPVVAQLGLPVTTMRPTNIFAGY